MKVKFNQADEFLAELEKDSLFINRRIVRLTNLYEASKLSPNIQHVTFLATYAIDNTIVELRRYCGDIWGINQESDDKVLNKAKNSEQKIENACKRLGLEARSGTLVEG